MDQVIAASLKKRVEVEIGDQKELTLNLHIRSLNMSVTEVMKVYLIWNRGNKQAKTKSITIKQDTPLVRIDEKFQINTLMDLDAEGKPTKPKMSYLTVYDSEQKDKILGKAELDLSQHSGDSFNILQLKLEQCQSEDAFIEVGLKATPIKAQTPTKAKAATTPNSEQRKSSVNSKSGNSADTQNVLSLMTELETAKKQNAKVVKDLQQKENNLNSKINTLQTQLENEKINSADMSKQVNFWNYQVSKQKDIASELSRTIAAQAQELEIYQEKFLENKQKVEIQARSKKELDEQLIELTRTAQQTEIRCNQKISDAIQAAQYFFDFQRFDTDFTQAFQDYEKTKAAI